VPYPALAPLRLPRVLARTLAPPRLHTARRTPRAPQGRTTARRRPTPPSTTPPPTRTSCWPRRRSTARRCRCMKKEQPLALHAALRARAPRTTRDTCVHPPALALRLQHLPSPFPAWRPAPLPPCGALPPSLPASLTLNLVHCASSLRAACCVLRATYCQSDYCAVRRAPRAACPRRSSSRAGR
jgi:hypothetical protein